jgi:hypothetical protein
MWQYDLVGFMGGPEHTAHTTEFMTEILNDIFVFIFTCVSVYDDDDNHKNHTNYIGGNEMIFDGTTIST